MFTQADGTFRPGLETILAEEDYRLFFIEAHMITGEAVVGKAAGDAIGPYQPVRERYAIPEAPVESGGARTIFAPYHLEGENVCVLGRHQGSSAQVWSADYGYPGDFDYREFHKKDGVSGLRYWRISGPSGDLADKDIYRAEWAGLKASQHAEHFAHLVESTLAEHRQASGSYGIVVAMFDTELFGHWWYEGVAWLEEVLRRFAASERVELTTTSAFLKEHPAGESFRLPEGSWGDGGGHFVWNNTDNAWMWPEIYKAERRLGDVASAALESDAVQRLCLNQACRELMLLQSSDWAFLITAGQAVQYARERFSRHLRNFEALIESLEAGAPAADLVSGSWEENRIFPDLDVEWFRT